MRPDDLQLWNLTPDTECLAGAQSIFNVLGHVPQPEIHHRLTYTLNDGPELAVAVQGVSTESKRLARAGDFNIDTIDADDLRGSNRLRLRLYDRRGEVLRVDREFHVRRINAGEPRWALDLHAAGAVHEIAQIVDGRWQLGNENGRPYIGITPEDAGYDRVLLIGHRDCTTGYEVRARFRVDTWTRSISQGVGGAFKWNAHRRGDGSQLPEEWSTGVAWAFSESPGLTIRFGVNATRDAGGRWLGESVIAEGSLSAARAVVSRLSRRLVPAAYIFPQIIPGIEYGYHLVVDRGRLALTIWDIRGQQPKAQVVAHDPPQLLPRGSVGWIAHHCAVRVYELSVSPLK
jgi:hypothetical protein